MPFFQQYLVFAHVAVKMAIPEIFHFIIIIVFVIICSQWSLMLLLQKDYNSQKALVMINTFYLKYFLIQIGIYIVFLDIMPLHT